MNTSSRFRILISGANGMLGQDLMKVLAPYHEAIGFNHAQWDISNRDTCTRIIEETDPDAIVNCAAYTKVDLAETHQKESFASNADGPKYLADICMDQGCRLIHISTDYVFDGKKRTPYRESDKVNPQSVYAKSKLAGEEAVMVRNPDALVVRSSGLYGVGGPCFPKTVLRFLGEKKPMRIVADQVTVPTYTADLAAALAKLIETPVSGMMHVVSGGQCSWFEFACAIADEFGLDKTLITPVTMDQYPVPAARPAYSVLDATLFLATTHRRLRSWREALTAYANEVKAL